MPFFDSDELKIHYEDRGSGDAAVLVHGFASNAQNNSGITGWLDLLARDNRVVTLDCRGHGQSDKPHERAAYTAMSMEDDVIALMDHAGIKRALLMGFDGRANLHGTAGQVSGTVPGRRVRRNRTGRRGEPSGASHCDHRGPPRHRRLLGQGRDSETVPPFAESNRNNLKALAACMGADRLTISATAFASNRVPVLLAVGSKDTAVGSTRALAMTIRNSRLVEIEGRDHLNTPGDKRYKEAVLEFFASAPP
jgi:pimeloyl-ACP methyl ester carboxylesterase